MSMEAVIESIERDAFIQTKKEEKMSLVEFVEKIAQFPLTNWQKEFLKKYEECTNNGEIVLMQTSRNGGKQFIMQVIDEWGKLHPLSEQRCSRCNRLLGKFHGQAEVKCPKCGEINRIMVD